VSLAVVTGAQHQVAAVIPSISLYRLLVYKSKYLFAKCKCIAAVLFVILFVVFS